eukprot:g10737.t1
MLPEAVCGFQEEWAGFAGADGDEVQRESWAEKWWEQCPVTKLDVSMNALEQIPPSIGRLVECEVFLASSNQLTEVPRELGALPLKQLNLRSNALTALPLELGQLCSLVELILSENRLRELPAEVMELETLDPWAEVLDLGSNHLTALPGLRPWRCRLLRLDVSQNRLALLPDALCCERLRELSAARNQLRSDGERWKSLVSVDLSGNQLRELRLSNLRTLDSLIVSGNGLILLELHVACPGCQESNKLRALPEGIPSRVPRLATLDFSNNDLTQLPPELGLATELKRVALLGNPLRSVRPELLRGSAEALKAFLRSRLADAPAAPGHADADDRSAVLRAAEASGQLEFGFWESLQVVSLTGNPLRALRQALLAKGWPAVAQHLRDRAPEQVTVEPEPLTGRPGAEAGCACPGQSNFHCGDFDKPNARSGLRVVDETQLRYFKLAVQQAEAAYHLEVGQPMFFTWLEEPSFETYVILGGFTLSFVKASLERFIPALLKYGLTGVYFAISSAQGIKTKVNLLVRTISGQVLSGATCAGMISGSIMAAEWASRDNAIIISSSVGYVYSLLTLLINASLEGEAPEVGDAPKKKRMLQLRGFRWRARR